MCESPAPALQLSSCHLHPSSSFNSPFSPESEQEPLVSTIKKILRYVLDRCQPCYGKPHSLPEQRHPPVTRPSTHRSSPINPRQNVSHLHPRAHTQLRRAQTSLISIFPPFPSFPPIVKDTQTQGKGDGTKSFPPCVEYMCVWVGFGLSTCVE